MLQESLVWESGAKLASVEGMPNGGGSPALRTNLAGDMDVGLIGSGW